MKVVVEGKARMVSQICYEFQDEHEQTGRILN